MYGAFLGDMIGAPYEFDQGGKTKDFPLFSRGSVFTDDSVMTAAVAEALMDTLGAPDETVREALAASMRKWGAKYPYAGYGARFRLWLQNAQMGPYNSYGNGSAMRVSSAGWLFETLLQTLRAARLTAEVTHNHPEGIKGAQATAAAIFMARTGQTKQDIRDYISQEFGYDLTRTCSEIRPGYFHNESCQKTVPEAITAFLEGEDFEDVIRTAVSLGGDCDTLTCIAGSIAEAFYGVPQPLKEACRKRLPSDMTAVLDRFLQLRAGIDRPEAPEEGNALKNAVKDYALNHTREQAMLLMRTLAGANVWIPCTAVMDPQDENRVLEMLQSEGGDPAALIGKTFENTMPIRLVPDILQRGDSFFFPVFSSAEEMGEYGNHFSKVEKSFAEALTLARSNERPLDGMVIDAFTQPYEVYASSFDLLQKLSAEETAEE